MRVTQIAILAILLVGCSTSGSYVDPWDLACTSEVNIAPGSVSETEQAHLVGVTSVLARYGFRLVSNPKSDSALQLRFDLNTSNPFNFRCTIVLLDQGTPIVSAESVNPGWGNLIVRGGNIRAIVRRATRRFGKELDHLQGIGGGLPRRCS